MTVAALPALWEEDVVDAAQLDINLQTEVGESLRCRLLNILHLHTLCGHAKYRVPNTFHLSYKTHQDEKIPIKSTAAVIPDVYWVFLVWCNSVLQRYAG